MNSRRRFLKWASTGILMAATPARALDTDAPRIGYLLARGPQPSIDGAFFTKLAELGYVEGRNIVIERRFADGRFEQLPRLARELVELRVRIIVAAPFPAAQAAKHATDTLPIVMLTGGDPVGTGLVDSLANPNGNVTGVSNQAADVIPKMLELLYAAAPGAARIALLVNPDNTIHEKFKQGFEETAATLGVGAMVTHAAGPEEFERAFDILVRDRAGGVIVPQDPMFFDQRSRLIEQATRRRLPMMAPFREFAAGGGLMSYGRDLREGFARMANFVDRILRGARPSELPIEQPTKFEFVVNLRAATALGIEVPQNVLLRADRVIE